MPVYVEHLRRQLFSSFDYLIWHLRSHPQRFGSPGLGGYVDQALIGTIQLAEDSDAYPPGLQEKRMVNKHFLSRADQRAVEVFIYNASSLPKVANCAFSVEWSCHSINLF